MPQLRLDPRQIEQPISTWKPSGPIPPKVREFGFFPNIDDWLPGDLLLVSGLSPNWIAKRIITAQERGGYSSEDACWHHAAVYIGDAHLCEASRSGVKALPIFSYVGDHILRVRRDIALTADQRYRIAV